MTRTASAALFILIVTSPLWGAADNPSLGAHGVGSYWTYTVSNGDTLTMEITDRIERRGRETLVMAIEGNMYVIENTPCLEYDFEIDDYVACTEDDIDAFYGGDPLGLLEMSTYCQEYNEELYDAETGSWVACLRDGKVLNENVPHDGRFSFPMAVGDVWINGVFHVNTIDGYSGAHVSIWEVIAYESVTVPAGTFMAFRIDYNPEDKYWAKNPHRIWYAPGEKSWVKMLRSGTMYELSDHSVIEHTPDPDADSELAIIRAELATIRAQISTLEAEISAIKSGSN